MKLKQDFEKYKDLKKNGFLFDADTQTIYTDKKKPLIPEGFDHWEVENVDFSQYCAERLTELGIEEEGNTIELVGGVNLGNDERTQMRVFHPNKFGDIEILQYSLNR